jgi:signal peptidase I
MQQRTRSRAAVAASALAAPAMFLALSVVALFGGPSSPSIVLACALWFAASVVVAWRAKRPLSALGLGAMLGVSVLLLVAACCLTIVRVEGDSMRPTLLPGDVLLVDRLATLAGPFEPGLGIYVLDVPGEEHSPLVKRLVGRPGQSLRCRFGRLFADGVEVHPRDGRQPTDWNLASEVVPFGHLEAETRLGDAWFFLGDNPERSRDSRHFGPVTGDVARGCVIWRLRGASGPGAIE